MTDAIIERLKHIGLNSYEAKVYLALLKHHPATGYEVSKDANVPQARAYDTLKALEAQRMVVVTGTKPVTYIPVPPEDILSRFEHQYQGSIDYLRELLPSYAVETVEPVHNLRGTQPLYQHVNQMIDSAQSTVFMEMWQDDQAILEPALHAATQRGVSVHVVGYNNPHYPFCSVYQHPLEGSVEATLGVRWLIMAVDAAEGLVATWPAIDKEPHALWTKNAALVLVIKELVVHDIFLLDVEKTLKEPMEKAYGSHRLKLRNKILGNEILIGAH